MSSPKRRKNEQTRGAKHGASRVDARVPGGVSLAEAGTERASPAVNALSFVGYMVAAWLIFQPINAPYTGATFGFVWSPSLLGVVLGIATALVKNERGVRSRLGITDFSSRRATLVWAGLGVAAILAVMTLPR